MYSECLKIFKNMLPVYMSSKRLTLNINEAFRTIASKDNVKISNFQEGGRSPNAFSWDFVWVNQDIVLNVFTNFQPVISFSRVKAIFCLIAMDCYNPRRGPPNLIYVLIV